MHIVAIGFVAAERQINLSLFLKRALPLSHKQQAAPFTVRLDVAIPALAFHISTGDDQSRDSLAKAKVLAKADLFAKAELRAKT